MSPDARFEEDLAQAWSEDTTSHVLCRLPRTGTACCELRTPYPALHSTTYFFLNRTGSCCEVLPKLLVPLRQAVDDNFGQQGRLGAKTEGRGRRREVPNDSMLGRAHWPSKNARSPMVPACAGLRLHCCPHVPQPQLYTTRLPKVPSQSGLVTQVRGPPGRGQGPKNSSSLVYGRDARMPSGGRLIPVSGGFQNRAAPGPLCTTPVRPQDGKTARSARSARSSQPALCLLMRRETRSWTEINQDPNR